MCFLPHRVRALIRYCDERIILLARLIRRLTTDSYHAPDRRDLLPLLIRRIIDCANGRRRRRGEDLRLGWYRGRWRLSRCDGRRSKSV